MSSRDLSMRGAALTAATCLLVMAVTSPIGYFYVLPRLVDRANIVHTAQNIVAHQGLFLAGISCFFVTFLADVVAAWALYVFLRPAHATLSMLAASVRVVYAAMALSTLMKLVDVLRILRVPDYGATFGPGILNAQAQLLLSTFRYDWGFGMLVFGAYLVLLGTLAFRSGYVPRLLGALLVINGIACWIDSLHPYLLPGANLPFLPVLFFGELLFMLWLFLYGSRIRGPASATTP